MSNNSTNTDLLIQYLDGDLDAGTRIDVEKRLAKESDLKEELHRLQLAREAIRLYGLKEHVRSISKQLKTPSRQRGIVRNITTWSLRVAAILVLLIAGFGIYEYSTLSGEKLYSQLYEPYQVRSSRGNNGMNEVEQAFQEADYAKAINVFSAQSNHSTADYFFVGLAYLQENNTANAVAQLENALASSKITHTYSDEIEFYLALAYMRANEINKARPLLEKIHSDANHLFHDKVDRWFMKKLFLVEEKSGGRR